MIVIGLTGGLGTGKSTVAAVFSDLGARIVDADRIAHRLMAPDGSCFRVIVRRFGKDVVNGRRVNRKKLAQIVFQDKQLLNALEEIIHPRVQREMMKRLRLFRKNNRIKAVVLDVPLLIESGLHKKVDAVVVVKSNRDLQIKRVKGALGLSRANALARIKAQMPIRQKLAYADYVVDNRGSMVRTKDQVRKIWKDLFN